MFLRWSLFFRCSSTLGFAVGTFFFCVVFCGLGCGFCEVVLLVTFKSSAVTFVCGTSNLTPPCVLFWPLISNGGKILVNWNKGFDISSYILSLHGYLTLNVISAAVPSLLLSNCILNDSVCSIWSFNFPQFYFFIGKFYIIRHFFPYIIQYRLKHI